METPSDQFGLEKKYSIVFWKNEKEYSKIKWSAFTNKLVRENEKCYWKGDKDNYGLIECSFDSFADMNIKWNELMSKPMVSNLRQ